MPQWVIEFASPSAQAIISALKLAAAGQSLSIEVDRHNDGSFRLEIEHDPFPKVASRLAEGSIFALLVRPSAREIRYGLATCPQYSGQKFPYWLGTIESTGPSYKELWEFLLGVEGLILVSVGFEEGVELGEMESVSVETFPWDRWSLVIGAIRSLNPEQPWVIRPGPRFARDSSIPVSE